MFEVVSILDLIIGVLIIIREVRFIKVTHFFSIKNACNLAFALYLFLIPSLFLWFCPLERAKTLMLYDRNGVIESIAFSLICYIAFNIGYELVQRKRIPPRYLRQNDPIKLSLFFVIIGFVCFFLWARSFGGINALLLNAGAIRSGYIQAEIKTAFFKHPTQLAKLCSLYVFVVFLTKRKVLSLRKKISLYLIGGLAFGISILYIMADDSRSGMGLYFLSFMIVFLFKTSIMDRKSIGNTAIKTIVLVTIILFAILNGDIILGTLRGSLPSAGQVDSTEDGFINSMTRNFSSIVQSIFYAVYYIEDMNGKLLIWDDFITGVTAWLPSSIKPFPDAVRPWDVNTTIHCLHTELYGQYPHPIVANCLYDLSYAGLFIIPCILGMIVKKVENVLIPRLQNPFYLCLYCSLFLTFSNMIQGFCLYYIMLNTFYLIVGLLIFLLLSKKRKASKQSN